jgi:hypothetical protein
LWYDPYTYIIELFIEKNPEWLEVAEVSFILNRGYLKTIIMVVNYNAGIWECMSILKKKLTENGYNTHKSYNYSPFVSKLHAFLNDDLFTILYKKNKDQHLETVQSYDVLRDANINYLYHKMSPDRREVKIESHRWIFIFLAPTKDVDFKKSIKALSANHIQAADAEFLRYLIARHNLLCVHDSFNFNLRDTGFIMDSCNNYYKFKLKKNTYAMFIIL